MKLLKIFRDSDLGMDLTTAGPYKERRASRAIVFDNSKNIALLHVRNRHYHKLPGGGIDEGEDIQEALARELLEEIGCAAENFRELGVIEEYRNKFLLHQTSYCFVADLSGEKGTPNLEEGEIADGFKPVWMPLEEAIRTLESEAGVEDYSGKFIQFRDLLFLKEALK
jgi:8-oxo-dGTP pyrophosphatase MutT (NUDIX family)